MRDLAAAAVLLATLALVGCPKAQAPTPGELSMQLRAATPGYALVHAAAAGDRPRTYLHVRESALADLVLGSSPAQAKARYGDPKQIAHAPEGDWWEYEEVLKVAENATPPSHPPARDEVGTLRLLFVPLTVVVKPAGKAMVADASASGAAAAVSPKLLSQIQAWAPGRQETRSLVRLLDPVARVESKYGAPARKLAVGKTGGELWLYPAADVGFVVSPPEPVSAEVDGPATAPGRVISATIVGL